MQLTYHYRVKDKYAAELSRQARAVNFVWNYCNEVQQKAVRDGRKWLNYSDLARLTAGSGPLLDLHSHTLQRVCRQYDKSRRQHKRPWLRFRARKSRGWVPFNTGHVSFRDGGFFFRGRRYDVWLDRAPPEGSIFGAGSFSQDACGRWYLNIPVDVECAASAPLNYVGIDLGQKYLATLSDENRIVAPRFYRDSEARLAKSQRARKSQRVRTIHTKIANRRKDFLHKESSKLAKQYGLIVVGDVSAKKIIAETTISNIAKAQYDVSWASFKMMLAYKSIRNGGSTLEAASEANTSRICAACGCMAGPEGRAGLNNHDRDVNAARNILRLGLQALAAGAPVVVAGNPGLQAGE